MAERGRLTERLAEIMAGAQEVNRLASAADLLGSVRYQGFGVEAEATAAALDANVAAEGRATRLARVSQQIARQQSSVHVPQSVC